MESALQTLGPALQTLGQNALQASNSDTAIVPGHQAPEGVDLESDLDDLQGVGEDHLAGSSSGSNAQDDGGADGGQDDGGADGGTIPEVLKVQIVRDEDTDMIE